MKKFATIALLLTLLPMLSFAQDAKYYDSGKMVATAGIGLSALQLGYGVGFEYGITGKFGIYPSYMRHNYSAGSVDWSFNVIDVWGTYHAKDLGGMFNFGGDNVDTYGMLGVTFASFGVDGLAGEESSSSFGFGIGAGGRYYFSDNIAFYGEGKYRFASFESDSYNLAIAWYSINVGVSYAIR